MQVKFKKLDPTAELPSYAKPGDAGLDLRAIDNGNLVCENSEEGAYAYMEYKTGLAVEIPEGYVGLIFPRSSISNTALGLANAVGVIDSGYRGELRFRFRIDAFPRLAGHTAAKGYQAGDKIGQMIIVPYPQIEVLEADALSDTVRGTGGYGSSGK